MRAHLIRTVTALSLTVAGLLLAPLSFGQDLPTAADLLNETKSHQIPSVSYTVNVKQTTIDSASTEIKAYSFVVRFSPDNGMVKISQATTDTIPAQRAKVDLGTLINGMLSYTEVTLESIEIGGRPHFQFYGQDPLGSQELWLSVDQEHKRVSHVELNLHGQKFFEIDFEYEWKHETYSLPTMALLHYFRDDSRVVLEYSDYILENNPRANNTDI